MTSGVKAGRSCREYRGVGRKEEPAGRAQGQSAGKRCAAMPARWARARRSPTDDRDERRVWCRGQSGRGRHCRDCAVGFAMRQGAPHRRLPG